MTTPTTTPAEYATLRTAGVACALRDIADAIAGGRYDVSLDVTDAAFLAGEVARLQIENARLTRELKRASEGHEFYYDLHAKRQLRNAEEAWGLAGGGL